MAQAESRKLPDIRVHAVRGWPAAHGGAITPLEFSAAEKAELSRIAEVIEYKTKGSQIFVQGSAADFLYLVADGIVRSFHTLPSGERQILAFLWPGDLFGMPERGSYVNSAETIVPCGLYRFPRAKLEAFLRAHPKFQEHFWLKAVHDLRNFQRQLIVMGRFNIAQRLAAFLLDCSGHALLFDTSRKILTVPMSRYDIADYLGTSAETVTRAFGRLEKEGLIRRNGERTVKLDLKRIRSFLQSD
jgi:CRP-like cAMP-binding protein